MTLLLITHEPELARRCARQLEMPTGGCTSRQPPASGRLATDEVA